MGENKDNCALLIGTEKKVFPLPYGPCVVLVSSISWKQNSCVSEAGLVKMQRPPVGWHLS